MHSAARDEVYSHSPYGSFCIMRLDALAASRRFLQYLKYLRKGWLAGGYICRVCYSDAGKLTVKADSKEGLIQDLDASIIIGSLSVLYSVV